MMLDGDRSTNHLACRIIYDVATGTNWRVIEVDGAHVPGARGPSCLCFESDTAVRRVWRYPADWRTLPVEDLMRLSWGK